MNRQLERAPLCLLPDWSPFNSISVSLIKCKTNHQYLGPGNAEPVILIVIGWRELLRYICVCLWPLITFAVYFLKPSINMHFEFLYLKSSWFWFSVDVSRLLCLMLMCYHLPKFGRVLIEAFYFFFLDALILSRSPAFSFFLRLILIKKAHHSLQLERGMWVWFSMAGLNLVSCCCLFFFLGLNRKSLILYIIDDPAWKRGTQ